MIKSCYLFSFRVISLLTLPIVLLYLNVNTYLEAAGDRLAEEVRKARSIEAQRAHEAALREKEAARVAEAEAAAEKVRREAMLHFCEGLLQLSPIERWTPRQVLFRHCPVTAPPLLQCYVVDNRMVGGVRLGGWWGAFGLRLCGVWGACWVAG